MRGSGLAFSRNFTGMPGVCQRQSRIDFDMNQRNAERTVSETVTLTDEAYRRLEEAIVTLEVEPGAVVSESVLSRRLGIGTTPVREALQRLARDRLVKIYPRRGVIITSVDVREQLEVLETRRELDRLVARKAATRATPRERQELAGLAQEMSASLDRGDVREFVRQDGKLNVWLSKVARNSIATEAAARLHSVSRRFWFYHLDNDTQLKETGKLHVALIEAIASGDDGRAAQASDRLIDHLVDFAAGTLPRD